MKKFVPVLVILMSLVITGCVFEYNSAEIAELKQKIEELQKEKTTDFFTKNQECYAHKEDLEKELSSLVNSEGKHTIRLKSLFYSPLKDTCLFWTYNLVAGSRFDVVENLFSREEIAKRSIDSEGKHTYVEIEGVPNNNPQQGDFQNYVEKMSKNE